MKRAAAFNQGAFPTIVMINKATAALGVDFAKLTAALQTFLDKHFMPVWGYPAKLTIGKDFVPGNWAMVFMDDADAANALGYHDLTKDGQPVSKVFVKATLAAGEKVSVTACHELAEMLIDPGCQLWADRGNGTLYAYEMCDAVEESTFNVDGIAMSNFVHPAFFEPWHKAGAVSFDHLGQLKRPFAMLAGGYQIVMKAGKQSQIFGSDVKARRFAKEDRRLHRSEYRWHRAAATTRLVPAD
jgi:hypothetical protein